MEQKNRTIDRLPAATWNWLHMNGVDVTLPAHLDPGAVELRQTLPAGVIEEQEPSGAFDGEDIPGGVLRKALRIPAGASVGRIELGYHFPAERAGCQGLTLTAGAGSQGELLLDLSGEAPFAGAQLKLLAQEGARVKLFVAQRVSQRTRLVQKVDILCEKGAQVELVCVELGGGETYLDLQTELVGKASAFTAHMAYYVKTGQKLDMNVVARHRGEETRSEMTFSGVLEEGADKLLRDTIDFCKGCTGAKGEENEQVLLLGKGQKNGSIPLILCQEERVEGSHGASIGRLEESMLFYLTSRGLSRAQAEEQMAQARIEAVLRRFPTPESRQILGERSTQWRGASGHGEL